VKRIIIRNGRVIDPAANRDEQADLYVENGRIGAIGKNLTQPADLEIDASGRWVIPGLVDLHARLREPGQEHKGTIASETTAAAKGGITTLCCPPDTDPVVDTEAVAEHIRNRAARAGHARVLPLGALTRDLAGEQLAEMAALHEAGCVAMGNARRPVTNTQVMRRALEYAATLDLTVFLYPDDPWLAGGGAVHEGVISARLGLAGIPECAEVIGLGRDLELVAQTGVRAHFCQLSTARAVEMVAEARDRGLPVTADVSAHQLYLTEIDVGQFDSRYHLLPPLRTQRDRDALRRGVANRAVQAICSDHQPHDPDAKLAPFPATEPGGSTLETLLPLTVRLVEEGILPLPEALATVTSGPAQVLNIAAGTLGEGVPADLCVFDPDAAWTVSEATLASHGKNSPFLGWELKGRVTHTLLDGRLVYESESGTAS
jgi:dihydroorotase